MTPFSDVYELFLSQVKSYEILEMDEATMEANMELWLTSSMGQFHNCRKDLRDYDLEAKTFAVDLNMEEKAILAKYMLYAYILTYIIKEENLEQSLNSKDYRMYSPANQLKALGNLRDQIYNEAESLKKRYANSLHNIKELFKK